MAKWILSAFADEASPELTGQIEALEQEGITRIELRGVDGVSGSQLSEQKAQEVKHRLDDHGIRLSALGSPFGKYPIEAPFEAHLDAFKRGLEICRTLDCDRIRMFSFFLSEPSQAEQWRGKVFDQLDQMLLLAEDAGVTLVHENEKAIYGDTIDRCAELMQAFRGRMGFVLDPANFIQCGQGPLAAYERLKDDITYLHIKDALFADGSVVPAGRGDGHVAEILRRVHADRDGEMILTIEPHLSVFAGLSALQTEELRNRFVYADSRQAFHAACGALKEILGKLEG